MVAVLACGLLAGAAWAAGTAVGPVSGDGRVSGDRTTVGDARGGGARGESWGRVSGDGRVSGTMARGHAAARGRFLAPCNFSAQESLMCLEVTSTAWRMRRANFSGRRRFVPPARKPRSWRVNRSGPWRSWALCGIVMHLNAGLFSNRDNRLCRKQ